MIASSAPGIHTCQCAVCQSGRDAETIAHHERMNLFLSRLTEPQRRWYVGMLSLEPESPSDSDLARITGLDRKTIRRGRSDIETGLAMLPTTTQRRPGGGRIAAEKKTRNLPP
jgi:hypothetical protein